MRSWVGSASERCREWFSAPAVAVAPWKLCGRRVLLPSSHWVPATVLSSLSHLTPTSCGERRPSTWFPGPSNRRGKRAATDDCAGGPSRKGTSGRTPSTRGGCRKPVSRWGRGPRRPPARRPPAEGSGRRFRDCTGGHSRGGGVLRHAGTVLPEGVPALCRRHHSPARCACPTHNRGSRTPGGRN